MEKLEPNAIAIGAPQRLSSALTPVFKVGFSTLLLAIGVFSVCISFRQSASHWLLLALALPMAMAFFLLLAYLCFRLKRVTAHADHLVVGNYLTECDVPYDSIEEIKVYRGRGMVFMRLRLSPACRFGHKVHFLLPSTIAALDAQPEVRLLIEQCPRLRSRTTGRWMRALYLRLPVNDQ